MNYNPPYGYNKSVDFDTPMGELNANTTCQNMNSYNYGQNYGCGCPTSYPTYDCCNNVVETCNVEQIPHYVNYHTHVVNNCIKRHINVPTYSTSSEVRIINEYQAPYQSVGLGTNQGFPNLNNFFVPFPFSN